MSNKQKILNSIRGDNQPVIHYDDDMRMHCEDGPAYITNNGYKSWWIHGKRHREDGPAIEYPDGDTEWFYNDEPVPVKNIKELQSYVRNKAFW